MFYWEKRVFVLTKCTLINGAYLNCCVHYSKPLVGALMKLAAIQNDVLFSVIKVHEACCSEFGLEVKQELRLCSKCDCFCFNNAPDIRYYVPFPSWTSRT